MVKPMAKIGKKNVVTIMAPNPPNENQADGFFFPLPGG
jgi:hypothetical protein